MTSKQPTTGMAVRTGVKAGIGPWLSSNHSKTVVA